MELRNVRDAYEELSNKASDVIRQLSFAGIALVWLFKAGAQTAPVLDKSLLRASLFIFFALLLDLLQYLAGTTIWFAYFRFKESNGTKLTDDIVAPAWLTWPMWCLFYLKAVSMLIAYCAFVVPFLASKFLT